MDCISLIRKTLTRFWNSFNWRYLIPGKRFEIRNKFAHCHWFSMHNFTRNKSNYLFVNLNVISCQNCNNILCTNLIFSWDRSNFLKNTFQRCLIYSKRVLNFLHLVIVKLQNTNTVLKSAYSIYGIALAFRTLSSKCGFKIL